MFGKLPPEDYEEGMRGRLMKAMYGTRDAAQNWEFEYCEFMQILGLMIGKASPCVFYRQGQNRSVVQ